MSEAFILESDDQQYDNRLFIEITSSVQENSKFRTCCELGIFMYWTRNSMNNLLSYYGLVDARISASEKDLPVRRRKAHYKSVII